MLTIYIRPYCMPCNATKRAFDKRGIPYNAIDIEESPEGQEAVAALGYRTLPVVVVDADTHWCDFRPDRLAALEVPL